MNCLYCGRVVDEGWKFCSYCGERMDIACPSCGVQSPADALFCHDCGRRLTQAAASPRPPQGNAQQRRSLGLHCPRCRTVNEPESVYCYKCGLPLEDEADSEYRRPTAPTYQVSAQPFRSLSTRSAWAIGLLVVNCLATILTMFAAYEALGTAQQANIGQYSSLVRLEDALSTLDGFYALELVTYIPAIVAFLMWMNRASKNLELLGADGQQFSSGWAVGWWFMPLFNLFRPYQVLKEIWKGSRSSSEPGSWSNWRSTQAPSMLIWWWWIWLVANFSLGAITAEPASLDEFSGFLQFQLAALSMWVLSAVFAVAIVRRITRSQEEGHRWLMAG